MQMTPPLWQKSKGELKESLDECKRGKWKKLA